MVQVFPLRCKTKCGLGLTAEMSQCVNKKPLIRPHDTQVVVVLHEKRYFDNMALMFGCYKNQPDFGDMTEISVLVKIVTLHYSQGRYIGGK